MKYKYLNKIKEFCFEMMLANRSSFYHRLYCDIKHIQNELDWDRWDKGLKWAFWKMCRRVWLKMNYKEKPYEFEAENILMGRGSEEDCSYAWRKMRTNK